MTDLSKTKQDEPNDEGRFETVFPVGPKGTLREEAYITRMIQRDREANLRY